MTRGRLAVALTAVAVVVAVGVLAVGDARSPASTPLAAPAWPDGQAWHWRLEWASSAALTVDQGEGPVAFEGTSRVEGLLRARGLGEVDGRRAVAFALVEATLLEVTLNGAPARDAQGLEAALLGHEAVALFEPDGALAGVRFAADAAPLFQNFVHAMLGDAQQVVRPGPGYEVREETARGPSVTAYTRDGRTLRKHRARYDEVTGLGRGVEVQKLVSSGEATFSADGAWASVTLTERLVGQSPGGRPQVVAAYLSLRAAEAPGTPVPAGRAVLSSVGPAQAVGTIAPAKDAAAQMLAQRVAGLTEDELFDGVARVGLAGVMADQHRFALRATGLLLQRPELCAALAERLTQEGAGKDARAFGLQLLAGAGSPEAQAAMRDVVASKAVRDSDHRAWLFTQLALVEAPTVETVDFAVQRFREVQGVERLDAALVVGAAAGLFERQSGVPQPGLDALVDALAAARTDTEQVALLRSLGNAGAERLMPAVLSRAQSPSPAVRRAAADALRKTPTPVARRALETLAADRDVAVQREALATLAAWPLEAETLARLHDGVQSGALGPGTSSALVSLLAPHVDTQPAARELLAELLKRPVPDPSIHTRIKSLLGEPL